MEQPVKVVLGPTADQKLRLWVGMAKGEVSGLGIVREVKALNGTFLYFYVEDIHLLEQQSGAADTVLDDTSVGEYLCEMAESGLDISLVKLWWHSHGELKVFWSVTDEACIERLASSSYLVSIVTNKAGDMLARVDIYRPFHVTVKEVATEVDYPIDPELREFCEEEFRGKVRETSMTIGVVQRDELPPPPPHIDDLDAEVEALERLVSDGKMSVEEYEDRVHDLVTMDDIDWWREQP